MDNLRLTIENIFKGAGKSFSRFPAAILSAFVIAITAIVRIRMDWETQQIYSLLFNSIQISFLLGAVFSMAAVALEEVRYSGKKSSFLIANISGIAIAIISFLLLYFYGGIVGEDKIAQLSNISMARVSAGIFISIVAFVYIVSKAKAIDSFSDSFFITHRAFIISAIYGLVMMIGISGVVGAFEALVYRGLSSNIYQYLGVVIGFLTYTIFLGYFPSFRPQQDEEEVIMLEEQPRFIFVLFEYILVPILMALTVVLLIWSVRVMLKGIDVSFNQLSSIASSYVIIGIWLHIMVAKHKTKLAEFYKRFYPFAGVLILIFEAWALFVQLNKLGLKTAEYSFLMIWIFAVISVLLLIFLKERAYRKIAITAIVISIIWVLPIIGYQDITFSSQVNRLEKILKEEDILVDGKIVAKDRDVKYEQRGKITDSVDFISYSEKKNTPAWFKKDLNNDEVFNDTFGFKKTYGVYDDSNDFVSTNFRLKEATIDISNYDFSLNIEMNETNDSFNKFEGKGGTYQIIVSNESASIPEVVVKLNEKIIIEQNLSNFIEELVAKYPLLEEREQLELPFEEMNMVIEDENVSVLLVFNNIGIYGENANIKTEYFIDFHGIYIKYK